MAKRKIKPMYIILIVLAFFVFSNNGTFFQGAISGSEVVARTSPNDEVNLEPVPGGTYHWVYTMSGSGDRAASIEDVITDGDCLFSNGKKVYKDVIISDAGISRVVEWDAPSTDGTCTFQGTYKFGTYPEAPIITAKQTVVFGNPDAECTVDDDCQENQEDYPCYIFECGNSQTCGSMAKPEGTACTIPGTTTEFNGVCMLDESSMECVDPVCTEDWSPSPSETCSTNTLTQYKCYGQANQESQIVSGTQNCGGGCDPDSFSISPEETCIGDVTVNQCGQEFDGTKDCTDTPDTKCEFWEKPDENGDCQLSNQFLILAGLGLFFIILLRG